MALPVNGDGFDAHFATSENDPASDFSSIGNEDFIKSWFVLVDFVSEIKGFMIGPGPRGGRPEADAMAKGEMRRGDSSGTAIADKRMEGGGRRRRIESLSSDEIAETADAMERPRQHHHTLTKKRNANVTLQ